LTQTILILGILLIHYIADFWVQTSEEARNKSHSITALLSHTFSYSFFFIIPMMFIFASINKSPSLAWEFCAITFVLHTITDFFTSRVNAYFWRQGRDRDFFKNLGFDQLLHFIQLLLTFQLLQ